MHQLSLRAPDLQTFICFSSVASVWGSKGQGPYAAANAFLDALAAFAIVWVFPPQHQLGSMDAQGEQRLHDQNAPTPLEWSPRKSPRGSPVAALKP